MIIDSTIPESTLASNSSITDEIAIESEGYDVHALYYLCITSTPHADNCADQ